MAQQTIALTCLLLASIICSAYAQIPSVCTDEASLRDLTCCPSTSDGVCGVNAGRGVCANLDLPNHSNSSSDVRDNWPHYYIRVCQCSGNFSGFDCSRYGNFIAIQYSFMRPVANYIAMFLIAIDLYLLSSLQMQVWLLWTKL